MELSLIFSAALFNSLLNVVCNQQGRCNREKPPCKYFHPPQHLKDQLLINGRNHLALKNALLQQIPLQPLLTGQLPTAVVSGLLYSQLAQQQQQQQQLQQQQQCAAAFNLMNANALKATTSPYLPAMASTFSPYLGHTPMMTGLLPADALASPLSLVPSPLMTAAQKLQRTDRLEVCREFQRGNCKRTENECRFAHPPEHVTVDSGEGTVTVCMDFVKGRCTRDQCRYFHPPAHLQAQLKAAQTRAGAAAVVGFFFPSLSAKSLCFVIAPLNQSFGWCCLWNALDTDPDEPSNILKLQLQIR
ncbi:Muscleblind-like protein 1 [Araneus ventricosus]|uniref:Muscleblind-like protein 1 n=1 Tax=Araneus ventricosus TaxID=182803 RepID=A0A4Y2GNG6_ARAVE|nr:Muscleblind-like protein 1 [Araneus ventricosus]